MREMAAEYRKETVLLSLRIRAMEEQEAPAWEIAEMRKMLREMRQKQRLLSTYYDSPRDAEITMSGAYAPKRHRDDEK